MGKPALRRRRTTISQLDQLGSIKILCFGVWTRNEAWPIQVIATWLPVSLGKMGRWLKPALRTNNEGKRTSVMKLGSDHFSPFFAGIADDFTGESPIYEYIFKGN